MAMVGIKTLNLGRKVFSRINVTAKDCLIIARFSRGQHNLSSQYRQRLYHNNIPLNIKRIQHIPLAGVGFIRWSSQSTTSKSTIVIDESSLPPIPTPPVSAGGSTSESALEWVPVGEADKVSQVVEVLGEPSLASYGLAGWSPVGLVQRGLEFLHITCDLPWWGTIVLGTVILRTLVFPLVILAQRNAARMSNNFPQLQRLQDQMSEARQSGNNFEAARVSQELMMFMREKKLNPLANIFPPLAQAPMFISMFMGLRSMCNVPVESLKEGGLFWFVDLTVPDQFYLLPIITSLTLAATIELGTDSARASSLGMMKYALRCLPIVIFPFTMNFPGAILCYWVSTNFISLIQVGFLRIPRIRNYFKIEPMINHPPSALPPKKGFVKGFKESMTNMKITKEVNERAHIDSVIFQRAGRAPIQRTFKYDPTKVKTTPELLSKKKDQ